MESNPAAEAGSLQQVAFPSEQISGVCPRILGSIWAVHRFSRVGHKLLVLPFATKCVPGNVDAGMPAPHAERMTALMAACANMH